ncbi:hypothetical protein RN001_000739 [Aquatica leii]|uniref:Translin-associated protein X n=1 Tax=Aquatica leii TaxID=1421715 RepID=A0AAN7PFQ2_9COLE|nr:hypothetical protein RN001_000739 [Aquatica leii]
MSASRGHKNGNYNKYKKDHSKLSIGDKRKELEEHVDENNKVIQMFRQYTLELDAKHDRYERIVKLSRDITIESKRIIFLLHNAATDIDKKKEQIYNEADLRLNQLIEKNFKLLSIELHGQDPYLYLRAYTAGLQEFIEALLYYQFLRYGSIEPWKNLITKFQYSISNSDNHNDDKTNTEVCMTVPPMEFFLGLGDFTGELLRKCINSLGSGNIEECFQICNYVKDIYTGFLRINCSGYKDLGRKVYVLKQSLQKMEYACYTIQVRGSEIPRHMLATVVNTVTNPDVGHEEDEGFY